jgi:ribonuclease BN (tRNA processing enzyme)
MKLEVLGADGSAGFGQRPTCLLVNDQFMIDSGVAVSGIAANRLPGITHVLLTHCHFDHILELPFLPFARASAGDALKVLGSKWVVNNIRKHVFTSDMWFDLSKKQGDRPPLVEYLCLKSEEQIAVGSCIFMPVPVSHGRDCHGVFCYTESNGFAFTSDTGPTKRFWELLGKMSHINTVIVDCSYPSEYEKSAISGGHLTPKLVENELEKTGRADKLRVFLFHSKPEHRKELEKEASSIFNNRARYLLNGETLTI